MKKNLITFAVIAFGGYFAYKWYSKKQQEKREAQEKAKAAAEPIKVEVKETSGNVGESFKGKGESFKEDKVVVTPNAPIKPDLSQGGMGMPLGEGNPRYKKPIGNRNEFMAPPRPRFNPNAGTNLGASSKIKGGIVSETT
jgi:hypothetical protein